MNANDLHWTESNIEKIETSNKDLIVWANNVIHPETNASYNVKVIFQGVIETNRNVTEYIGDPKGNPSFNETYTIEDLPKQKTKV